MMTPQTLTLGVLSLSLSLLGVANAEVPFRYRFCTSSPIPYPPFYLYLPDFTPRLTPFLFFTPPARLFLVPLSSCELPKLNTLTIPAPLNINKKQTRHQTAATTTPPSRPGPGSTKTRKFHIIIAPSTSLHPQERKATNKPISSIET